MKINQSHLIRNTGTALILSRPSEDQHAECDKTGGIGIETCSPPFGPKPTLKQAGVGVRGCWTTPPSFSFIVMFIISCIFCVRNSVRSMHCMPEAYKSAASPALSGRQSNFQLMQVTYLA